jgi:hypothetical protein
MTDISVTTTQFQVEKRSWLIPQPGGVGFGFTESGVLDVSTLTAATHYPNGYVPSGLVLGVITASSDANHTVYGAYDDTAVDGRAVAAGLLFSYVRIPNLSDLTVDPGIAVLKAFAVVKIGKLPVQSAGTPTGRGYIDANGQADLPRIHFIA